VLSVDFYFFPFKYDATYKVGKDIGYTQCAQRTAVVSIEFWWASNFDEHQIWNLAITSSMCYRRTNFTRNN